MPVELERDLGLYATLTVSIGAMIGSGIFVLPGLAFKIAGPTVVLAYLLAGIVVLPAALSKAEMATAMPEAGGTYLYIDRAMGPLFGTIAGLGAWFSLTFKSAFALVGLGAYLVVFSALPTVPVAVALAILLVVVNVVGVKQTGRFQAAVVTAVLLVLVAFIADGLTFVRRARFHPFFSSGEGGLLAATGFVFVSYAGVTKIASVAEEVENPGRNIPLGILGSVVVMMLVYTLTVFVVVGVTPAADLTGSTTPMTVAARNFLGPGLAVGVAAVAVLALVSMANAGVLSSSRFPFAMSRDSLAPPLLGRVGEHFGTPVVAIALTGGLLVALIAFVPVFELAKLASAFKILVFSFVNVALVIFRESDLDSYDPEFVAPGYPWVQLFGLGAGLALLTQMGALPVAGAVGIILGGLVWYRLYGRERTDREGAALDAIRRSTGDYSLDATRARLTDRRTENALVAVGDSTAAERERTLLTVARSVVGHRPEGSLTVARFDEVPEQVTLSRATEIEDERETELLDTERGPPVTVRTVVAHETDEAVANYARENGVDLVVGEWEPHYFRASMLGTDVDWYMHNVPADLVFVRDRGFDDPDTVAVVADQGPYDPLQVLVADAVATAHDARLRFLYALSDASEEQFDSTTEYHEALADLTRAETDYAVLRTDDRRDALYHAATDADVAVVATSAHHLLYDVVFGSLPDSLAADLPCTVLLTHAQRTRTSTFLRYLLDRVVF